MGLLERLRAQPGWKDPDPKVRRGAVRALHDPALLAEVVRIEADDVVRDEATAVLLEIALRGGDAPASLAALAALDDPKRIVAVARSASEEAVSRAALARVTDVKALGSVARHGEHAPTRLEALARLAEPDEIAAVALRSPHKDASLAALERVIASPDVLAEAAERARCPAAAHRARAILHARDEAGAAAGAPARLEADRRRQIALCEQAETLARSTECEPLASRIASLKDSWTDLIPNVEDALHERFTAALQKGRARLARNLAERVERERRAQEDRALRDRHLAPRIALCETVERAQGDEAPRALDDARWEWERLKLVDTADPKLLAEADALARRFEEACAACQARHEQWQKEQAEAARTAQEAEERAERARRRREKEARERDNAERLRKLCERAERLLRADALELKKARPALREVRAALDEMPPLPSRREHHAMVERLKAIQAALSPKVKDLREADAWKRWANANVQEELCVRAEALRDLQDRVEAARLANDLMERWKSASTATPDKSQELWLRFKTARDEILARLETHHAEQAARKQALCEQVEALTEPFAADAGHPGAAAAPPAASEPPAAPEPLAAPEPPPAGWVRTAEAIKRLQAEWKTIGPAARAQERRLWERFRKACDRFFARRAEDLARRKEGWAKNLERKEALCLRAEALADSTDWKGAAAEFKSLQAEWKGIGPVRKSRAEAIWARFHSACDRFFDRYKRRDQIEMEATLTAREAILRELEALLSATVSPSPGPPGPAEPRAAAEAPGPAGAPATGEILKTLQAARKRWQECGALPREQATSLEERFDAAVGGLIARFPGTVKGTDLDVEQNHRRMEELCARVERLLPGAGSRADASLSPAARLATHWREALASNTIGGKAAEEAKWRAAADEAKKVQAAWQKIGYVPAALRRQLSERVERACRKLAEQASRGRPAAAPASTARRGR